MTIQRNRGVDEDWFHAAAEHGNVSVGADVTFVGDGAGPGADVGVAAVGMLVVVWARDVVEFC